VKGPGGRVVLFGGAYDPAHLTERAREVLEEADLVVAPEGAGVPRAARASLDEILERARGGHTVAWIRGDAFADEATRLALARAEVVAELAWLTRGGLFGKRILVTRALATAEATADLLRARGAEPVLVPAIEFSPPKDAEKLTRTVARLAEATLVVFTSANGALCVFEELKRQKKDARAFGRAKVAAIGPATAAALAERGIVADVVAKEFKQEGLAEAILEAVPERGKALLLRAEVARDALPIALREAGFEVEVVPAYETRPASPARAAALARELEAGKLDAVTFTSPSTVENLCAMLGERAPELLGRACVASIGPVTTKACEARGIQVGVTARTYTTPGLVSALEAHFSSIDKLPHGRRSSA
jgi:uroporphyrinogen III methyltransferase/synthase